MEIKEALFVVSSANVTQCPKSELPEYAFIGRSNVGKSSLINMLCQRKALAKTSSTPGKTQLINHFLINKDWHLVDLPGYGYAKVSKTLRATFSKLILDYLNKRENLVHLFVLIDSRLKPQAIDVQFVNMIGEAGLSFSVIFTKSDKINQSDLNKNISLFKEEMSKSWDELPQFFVTSSAKSRGRDEVLSFVDQMNGEYKRLVSES